MKHLSRFWAMNGLAIHRKEEIGTFITCMTMGRFTGQTIGWWKTNRILIWIDTILMHFTHLWKNVTMCLSYLMLVEDGVTLQSIIIQISNLSWKFVQRMGDFNGCWKKHWIMIIRWAL